MMRRSMVAFTVVVAAAFLASSAYAKKSGGANALNDSSKIHACVANGGSVKILYVPGIYGNSGDTCGNSGMYFEWSPSGSGGTGSTGPTGPTGPTGATGAG